MSSFSLSNYSTRSLALEKPSRLPRASFTPFLSLLSFALDLLHSQGICILRATHKVFSSSLCASFDVDFVVVVAVRDSVLH